MFAKLFALFAFLAVAFAAPEPQPGYVASPLAYSAGYSAGYAAPLAYNAYSAPVVRSAYATPYAYSGYSAPVAAYSPYATYY